MESFEGGTDSWLLLSCSAHVTEQFILHWPADDVFYHADAATDNWLRRAEELKAQCEKHLEIIWLKLMFFFKIGVSKIAK